MSYRLSIVFVCAASSFYCLPAYAKCDAFDSRISNSVKALSISIRSVTELMLKTKQSGKIVEAGKCATFLWRFANDYPLSLKPDEATRDLHEKISCLALERWEIVQKCKCSEMGFTFQMNEDGETEAEKVYNNFKKTISSIGDKAYTNPAISKWIRLANELRSCFDQDSVDKLRQIDRILNATIE